MSAESETKPRVALWVTLAVGVTLLVVFHQQALDMVVTDDQIGGYEYCASFETCATAAYDAMQDLPPGMKKDCVQAHTIAATNVSAGEQFDEQRVGNCRVMVAMNDEQLGSTIWKAW